MSGFRTMSSALTDVEVAITAATGMKKAPGLITLDSVPSTHVVDMYSCELQSKNTGREGDRVALRASHDLTVRFVNKINPNRASDDYKAALEREEKLIRALMVQSAIPAIRTSWLSTRRTPTSTREHLVTECLFNLEHYFPLNNTAETPGN